MSCKPTYKGVRYNSLEELYKANGVNIQQAQQLYSQYLNTIFPDSKVKDIVYHGTDKKFDKFDLAFEGSNEKGGKGKGFNFTRDITDTDMYGDIKISVILDAQNKVETDKEARQDELSYIDDVDEIVVYNANQIHILGSKQDIEDFKNRVNNKPGLMSPMTIKQGVSELFESNPTLANEVYKVLGFGQEWINTNKLNNKSFGISLNIAGNGIYTLKGKYTQEEVDEFTYKLLKAVVESPELENKILSIRTGGQTGFDEAGAKAGMRLGIPTMILAPKGWKFRNAKGQDISDEKAFKDRFKEAAPTEKAVPLEIFKTAGKITHVKLKDGKKYKVADVKSAMMEKMGYTPAEIGKILKKLC